MITVIGLGSLGSLFMQSLKMYLKATNYDGTLRLIDGDVYTQKNTERQSVPEVGENKAMAWRNLLMRDNPLYEIEVFATYVDTDDEHGSVSVSSVIEENSLVLCFPDTFWVRRMVSEECQKKHNAVLITAGSSLAEGCVYLYVRRHDKDETVTIEKYHPELNFDDYLLRDNDGCDDLIESEPQRLATNVLIAAVAFNLTCLLAEGKVDYFYPEFSISSNHLNGGVLSKKILPPA